MRHSRTMGLGPGLYEGQNSRVGEGVIMAMITTVPILYHI